MTCLEVRSPPPLVRCFDFATLRVLHRLTDAAMTSRLKHKLELENVNLKSSYLNESFVQVSWDALADAYNRLARRCPRSEITRRTSRSSSQHGSRRLVEAED